MTIEVLNVCKSYGGKEVLHNITLDISSGSVIALSGPPGSGKTTLVRILLGLEEADSGKVALLGDYKYDRINAGVVFQEDRLCPGLSAAENVAMVNEKLSVRIACQELDKLLPEGSANRPVEELTASERRMVCIVRACSIPADIRIMDAPFAGMTKEEKDKAVRYIRQVMANTPLVLTCLPGQEEPFARVFSLA